MGDLVRFARLVLAAPDKDKIAKLQARKKELETEFKEITKQVDKLQKEAEKLASRRNKVADMIEDIEVQLDDAYDKDVPSQSRPKPKVGRGGRILLRRSDRK